MFYVLLNWEQPLGQLTKGTNENLFYIINCMDFLFAIYQLHLCYLTYYTQRMTSTNFRPTLDGFRSLLSKLFSFR